MSNNCAAWQKETSLASPVQRVPASVLYVHARATVEMTACHCASSGPACLAWEDEEPLGDGEEVRGVAAAPAIQTAMTALLSDLAFGAALRQQHVARPLQQRVWTHSFLG